MGPGLTDDLGQCRSFQRPTDGQKSPKMDLAHTLHKDQTIEAKHSAQEHSGSETMTALLNRLHHEEDAATAVEYAIIAAIVGVALIGTLIAFRGSIQQMLNRAANVIRAS